MPNVTLHIHNVSPTIHYVNQKLLSSAQILLSRELARYYVDRSTDAPPGQGAESAGCRCLQAPSGCPEPCEGRSRGSAKKANGPPHSERAAALPEALPPLQAAMACCTRICTLRFPRTSHPFVRDPLLRPSLHSGHPRGACNGHLEVLSHTRPATPQHHHWTCQPTDLTIPLRQPGKAWAPPDERTC
jgi:hypothetical protein